MMKCSRHDSSFFGISGSARPNAALKRLIITAYCSDRNVRMNGAGSAYARPSRRRKFLPPRSRVPREPQRGDEHRRQDALARDGVRRGLVLERAQEVEPLLVHRVEPSREHGLEQLFLAAEVVVDRREIDAGRGRDRAQARRLEAVLHEQRLGRVEDPILRRGRDAGLAHRYDFADHSLPFVCAQSHGTDALGTLSRASKPDPTNPRISQLGHQFV